jgi:hypothetical protein
MTALFRGGELEAFIANSSGVSESTDGGTFNSTFARCAILLYTGSSSSPDQITADTMSWSAQTGDFYFHFEERDGSGLVSHTALELFSGSTANFRIRQTYSGSARQWTLQYLNASAVWTSVGSALTLGTGRADYDIYVNITTGVAKLYVRGSVSAATATGLSLGHMSGITKARLHSDTGGRYFSQIVADTTPTIGYRLASVHPNGAGSDSAWTGTYLNIDETTLDDADFVNSATANQVSTYTLSSVTLTGYSVQDVTVSFRSKCGGSGPQNIEAVLRSAGTNYFSSNLAQDVGYAPYQNTWSTDPATSADWVLASISSLQAGVKSIA